MFVRNKSTSVAHLSNDTLPGGVRVAALVVECVHRVSMCDDRFATLTRDHHNERLAPEERPDTAPPFPGRTTLWKGVSVTATGHVEGTTTSPAARLVTLRVGETLMREVVAYGKRYWRPLHGGGFVASEPQPLERIPMDWSLAYGGRIELLPGYFPGTDLPYPGGTLSAELNPGGKGFCPDPALADGVELPQFEGRDEPSQSPQQRPRPACLAPCPRLLQMRRGYRAGAVVKQAETASERDAVELLEEAVWMAHHAPGELVMAEAVPGLEVHLHGLVGGTLALLLPPPPVAVTFRYPGGRQQSTRGRIRSIHIDADQRMLRIVYGYLHRFAAEASPSLAHVTEAAPP